MVVKNACSSHRVAHRWVFCCVHRLAQHSDTYTTPTTNNRWLRVGTHLHLTMSMVVVARHPGTCMPSVYSPSWRACSRDTMPPSLPMVRLAAAKHTPWAVHLMITTTASMASSPMSWPPCFHASPLHLIPPLPCVSVLWRFIRKVFATCCCWNQEMGACTFGSCLGVGSYLQALLNVRSAVSKKWWLCCSRVHTCVPLHPQR